MSIKLIIGDFNKSSWSMRGWLALVTAGVPFDTVRIKLDQADTHQRILQFSPSGKVPALLVGDIIINDSLAISEYIADAYPEAKLWPEDPHIKALARSAVAEMHSGFTNLRTQMPFGLNIGETPTELTSETREEIQRIFSIWKSLRELSSSKRFLCGDFGIVDAMFVPVVFRFRRYGITIPTQLQEYTDSILNYPPVQKWLALAKTEAH